MTDWPAVLNNVLRSTFTGTGNVPPLEQGDGQYGTGLIEDIKALGLSEFVDDIIFVKLLALGSKPWDDSELQVRLYNVVISYRWYSLITPHPSLLSLDRSWKSLYRS
jgi:hypothetical protein